jgi:hypothetical protein
MEVNGQLDAPAAFTSGKIMLVLSRFTGVTVDGVLIGE